MKACHSTITSKGQITIPSSIRNKLHLSAGSKVEYILQDDHIILLPINGSATRLKGMLKKPSRAITIEEMNAAVRDVR